MTYNNFDEIYLSVCLSVGEWETPWHWVHQIGDDQIVGALKLNAIFMSARKKALLHSCHRAHLCLQVELSFQALKGCKVTVEELAKGGLKKKKHAAVSLYIVRVEAAGIQLSACCNHDVSTGGGCLPYAKACI
jgi:hypothetical protein